MSPNGVIRPQWVNWVQTKLSALTQLTVPYGVKMGSALHIDGSSEKASHPGD